MDELSCLNSWPNGMGAHDIEEELISALLHLCRVYGFGRVPQLAQQIEDIWRHPEQVAHYENERAERIQLLLADAQIVEDAARADARIIEGIVEEDPPKCLQSWQGPF